MTNHMFDVQILKELFICRYAQLINKRLAELGFKVEDEFTIPTEKLEKIDEAQEPVDLEPPKRIKREYF